MQESTATPNKRSLWIRGLMMVLMAMAYQLASTLLFITALIQFVLTLLSDTPNPRLSALGRSVGRYQGQIASFVTFASEEPAFPFADWPSGD